VRPQLEGGKAPCV